MKIIRKDWVDTGKHYPRMFLEGDCAIVYARGHLYFSFKYPDKQQIVEVLRLPKGGWQLTGGYDDTVYPCRMAAVAAWRLTQ